jgi:hypothetical protein
LHQRFALEHIDVIAEREGGAVNRATAAPHHDVHGNPFTLEDLEQSHGRRTLDTARPDHETDAHPAIGVVA